MKAAEIQQFVSRELDALIEREGGFVDHPHDRGGPTCWGITQTVARAAGYAGPMARLPRALAERLYRQRYWEAPGFGRVAERAPSVAAELFDTGVNMGPAVAIGFLQRALNALNRRERDWPDVPPTRAIDAATLAALDALLAKRGAAGEGVLVKALDALQGARYIELAEARPANESFAYGWLANRVG
jgi:lysozyme family protein